MRFLCHKSPLGAYAFNSTIVSESSIYCFLNIFEVFALMLCSFNVNRQLLSIWQKFSVAVTSMGGGAHVP